MLSLTWIGPWGYGSRIKSWHFATAASLVLISCLRLSVTSIEGALFLHMKSYNPISGLSQCCIYISSHCLMSDYSYAWQWFLWRVHISWYMSAGYPVFQCHHQLSLGKHSNQSVLTGFLQEYQGWSIEGSLVISVWPLCQSLFRIQVKDKFSFH